MGAQFDAVTPTQVEWIRKQKLFFVATSPPDGRGKVNVSPKGLADATFNVSDDGLSCWYVDMTGSGVETIAHLRATSRITIMFVELSHAAPLILRIYGVATVHEPDSPSYADFIPPTADRMPGTRAVISVAINKVTTACGWSVPIFQYVEDRMKLVEWSKKLEEADESGVPLDVKVHKYEGMDAYRKLKNKRSLDGLRGLDAVADVADLGGLSRFYDWASYTWRTRGGKEASLGFVAGLSCAVAATVLGRRLGKW
ncbi:hypothetical protein HDV00_009156 [Rhizophlyctis rosea]|nr:hypothetical protein HDV00_009156 [Rhizophlyctis rosea]